MRLATVLAGLVAAALAGCVNPDSRPAPTPNGLGILQPASAPTEYVLIVRLRMSSVEVPVGTASGSEEIWSYVDEERARSVRLTDSASSPQATSAPSAARSRQGALGRNGLRVGVARLDVWPDLSRILQKMTGKKVREDLSVAFSGRPFQIPLKPMQDAQTIFISYGDRTLSGADYPAGDYLLGVSCTFDDNDPTRVILTVMPQIRSTMRTTKFINDDGLPRMVDVPVVYDLDPVMFQLSLTGKEMVVLGPGAESRRPTSIGHQFLVKTKQDVPFETVLVLVPEIVKAPMTTQRPSP